MSESIVNSNNKIISREALIEIFEVMHKELEEFKRIAYKNAMDILNE